MPGPIALSLLAALLVVLVPSPAEAQLGNLRKKLEDKAKEQIVGKKPASSQPSGATGEQQRGTEPQHVDEPPTSAPVADEQERPEPPPFRNPGEIGIPWYPGANYYRHPMEDDEACCLFRTREPVEKVLAFYRERFGEPATIQDMERKYPEMKRTLDEYRRGGGQVYFFGQPSDIPGMGRVNTGGMFEIYHHDTAGVGFRIRPGEMDHDALSRLMREVHKIEPARSGGATAVAQAEDDYNETDQDIPLTQDVIDRYLRAVAVEAAETRKLEQAEQALMAALQSCTEKVEKALGHSAMSGGGFASQYCQGTGASPDPGRIAARSGGFKNYQYARLREHFYAYVKIRSERGANGIRQSDWKMWRPADFALLDRNWERLRSAH